MDACTKRPDTRGRIGLDRANGVRLSCTRHVLGSNKSLRPSLLRGPDWLRASLGRAKLSQHESIMLSLDLKSRLLVLSVCFAALIHPPYSLSQSEASRVGYQEAQIKAAFLFRLPKFIRWPDGRAASHFCFAEQSDVSNTFSLLARASRPAMEVSIVSDVSEVPLAACDVLFNAPSSWGEPTDTTLLVSDAKNSAQNGGMIELERSGSRLRLLINLKSMKSVELQPNSQLLKLSTLVGGS